jgi:mRNA-degrading endonuclease RelE of RelBE toxin-antitoxin system
LATFTPRISTSAAKYIKTLDKPTRERFAKKIQEVANDPYNTANSEPLTNSDKRKCKVGGYRLLCLVIPKDGVVLFTDAAPRGEVYGKKYK